MKKVLCFYWYVPVDYWNPVYCLHLLNISYYRDVFDEIFFAISTDGDDKLAEKTIESLRFFVPNARFAMVKNDKISRESKFFYEEIVNNLDRFSDNELVFFAHNKGADTNYVKKPDRNDWINSLYFLNLKDKNKIDEIFSDENVCAAGSGRMVNYAPHEFANFLKYRWMFAGTFFWIVPKRLKKYIENNKIEVIENTGRYYTEGFLGTIFPDDAKECVNIYPNKEVKDNWGQYLLKVLTADEISEYKKLYCPEK